MVLHICWTILLLFPEPFILSFPWSTSSSPGLAEQLIEQVNQLRVSKELNTLNINPILMKVAQEQANYMASMGSVTHLDGQGLRPFQRALLAGFQIAGDLEQGGFYSENIIMGSDLSPEMAVEMWLGDELHSNTMLSEYRSDIGVGVAIEDGYTYYCLDTSLLSRTPVTPPPVPHPDNQIDNSQQESSSNIVLTIKSTPNSDGTINHHVRAGESLWTIAAIYGITVDQLIKQNGLDPQKFIQPEDILIIQPPSPVVPTQLIIPTIEKQKIGPKETILQVTPVASLVSASMQKKMIDPPSSFSLIAIGIAFVFLITIMMIGFRKKKISD